jgi:hypothetical protein
MLNDYENRMLADYQHKRLFPKKIEELDEEAEREKKVKLLFEIGGKRYASYGAPGSVIKFKDGKEYMVDENGSLRRIQPKEESKK